VSRRVAAVLLFLGAFIALPLPLLGLAGVSVPVARFFQLAGALGWLIALEGSAGMVVPLMTLLLAHAVVYTALIAGAVWALSRFSLRRVPSRLRDHLTVIAVTLLLALGVYAELYDTAFHHASAHAKLLELYR